MSVKLVHVGFSTFAVKTGIYTVSWFILAGFGPMPEPS